MNQYLPRGDDLRTRLEAKEQTGELKNKQTNTQNKQASYLEEASSFIAKF